MFDKLTEFGILPWSHEQPVWSRLHLTMYVIAILIITVIILAVVAALVFGIPEQSDKDVKNEKNVKNDPLSNSFKY